MQSVSLSSLAKLYPWRVSFTVIVVVLESVLATLYPLLIGLAINDLIEDDYTGLIHLGLLGIVSAAVGTIRRYFDTRIYAGIFRDTVVQLTLSEQALGAKITRTSARIALFEEFIEFLEDSVPEIVGASVAIFVILFIVYNLDVSIFFACLALFVLFVVVYSLSAGYGFRLNKGFNDQLEQQVSVVTDGRKRSLFVHFGRMMRWRIRLSDLETVNFLIIWLGAVALIVYTPISAVSSEIVKYGLILSILMYVFEFIDALVELPLHVQQVIRLREISNRLSNRDLVED